MIVLDIYSVINDDAVRRTSISLESENYIYIHTYIYIYINIYAQNVLFKDEMLFVYILGQLEYDLARKLYTVHWKVIRVR